MSRGENSALFIILIPVVTVKSRQTHQIEDVIPWIQENVHCSLQCITLSPIVRFEILSVADLVVT